MSYVIAGGLGYPVEDLPTEDTGGEEEFNEEQLLAAALGISVDEFMERYELGSLDETTVSAQGIGSTPDLVVELSDLGLTGRDVFHEGHLITFVSEDGTDWSQVETGTTLVRSAITIEGGLVGEATDVTDGLRVSCSTSISPDGTEWTPISTCGSYGLIPWAGRGLWVGQDGLRVITIEGASQLMTAVTELDRSAFQRMRTPPQAGAAGIVFMTDYAGVKGPDRFDPRSIMVSVDGEMWARHPLPEEVVARSFRVAVGTDGVVLVSPSGEAWLGTFASPPPP